MTTTYPSPTASDSAHQDAAARTVQLTKIYGEADAEVIALDHVDVSFDRGKFTAVMGPSGSGKSTLMHCVAGLDQPSSGEVFIGDTSIGKLNDAKLTELRRDRIGFIFQAFNLIPTLTAQENIELPLAIAGRKPDQDWFDQVIDAVGLRSRLTHKPSQLSGGQQQRVACARALLSKPDIIFADEPTGNLDSTASAEILRFLARSVAELGQTIVMVTHDPNAASYADRALFLADGHIVGDLEDPSRDSVLRYMADLDGHAGTDDQRESQPEDSAEAHNTPADDVPAAANSTDHDDAASGTDVDNHAESAATETGAQRAIVVESENSTAVDNATQSEILNTEPSAEAPRRRAAEA